MGEPGDTLALARRQGYRNGYGQAIADAKGAVTEVIRHTAEHSGVAHYRARIEALRHLLTLIRDLARRARGREPLTLVHDPDKGCLRCPLSATAYGSLECGATMIRLGLRLGAAPDWCPLRSGPVVVRAPEGGDGG